MEIQCFVFAVIVALVFRQVLVPIGIFSFSCALDISGFWNSMEIQCFVFAVIVALVFRQVLVPIGIFSLSSIAYLRDLL